MRPKTLFTVIVLAVVAQAHGQEFLKHDREMIRSLKISSGLYVDFKSLAKSPLYADIFVRLGEGDLFPGWRPATRFEVAVTLHASVVKGFKIIDSNPNQLQLSELRKAIPIEIELCREFSSELKALDINTEAVIQGLETAQHSVESRISCRPRVPADRKLESNDFDRTAIEDLKCLVSIGAARNLPVSFHKGPTNYMAADCLRPTIIAMHEMLRVFAKPDCDDYIEFSMMAVDIGMATDNVRRLISHFTPELRARNINPDELRKQLHDIPDLVEACWSPEKISRWSELPAP